MLFWHLYAKPGSGSALASPPLASVVLTVHNFDSSGECRQDEFAATGVDGSAFATIDRALDERTIGHNPERLCLLKVVCSFSSVSVLDLSLSLSLSLSLFLILFPPLEKHNLEK